MASVRVAFATSMRHLIRGHTLDERYSPIPLASAIEMLLFKVQGPDLDLPLLEEWAVTLAMTDTWQRALVDAGLRAA